MICQATIAGQGFEAWEIAAPWCDKEAVTTVRLTLTPIAHDGGRTCNVWLCAEHAEEFYRAIDL